MQLYNIGQDHEMLVSTTGRSCYEENVAPETQDGDTIVIIGGGSIGLSTAYNLAQSFSDSSLQVRIIVIEFFDKPFEATSSTCTGCFHYGFPEKETQPLLPLGKYSFNLWAAHAENEEFRKSTGYRAQSSLGVNPGSGHGIDVLPDWIQTEPTWDIDQNVLGNHTATVNPAGIGKWLTAQCLNLGVEIRTGLKVVDTILSSDSKVQAVACLKKDQTTIRIDCTKLLVACGPWTPVVYRMLFSSSPVSLRSSINAGDWIVCKNRCPTTEKSIAFVSLANIISEKLEFAGRDDGTIWVCGRRNFTASLPPPGEIAEPDEETIKELSDHARKWLDSKCKWAEKHVNGIRLVSKGRAFRPATKSGLPIISKVAPSDLMSNTGDAVQSPESSSGVFVCWGHGSYGLTLGMGTGRLMSQLMRGEKPDLDLSLFDLSRDNTEVDLTLPKKGARCCNM